ncbi:O-antigen ligase family protein [Qipengyuania flava]|uniref:O-antigen ligase family protein n=1 Tax=Qipengyuania flava TaxID=192812 RepID=UPI0018DEF1ED|nr:O-antigen ligase family protein [Qipengyuania flava]
MYGWVVSLAVTIQSLLVVFVPPQIVTNKFERSSGIFGDPNIVMLHIIPFYFLAFAYLRLQNALKFAVIPVGLLVVLAALASGSRSGIFALIFSSVLAAGYMVVLRSGKFGTWRLFQIVLLIGVMAGIFGAIFSDRIVEYTTFLEYRTQERIDQKGLFGDRLEYIAPMLRLSMQDVLHPLGFGYDIYFRDSWSYTLPHNTFADVLIIAGPFAFFIYLAAYGYTFLKLSARSTGIATSPQAQQISFSLLLAIISQFLLLNTLSVLTMKAPWLLLGMCLGILREAHGTTLIRRRILRSN